MIFRPEQGGDNYSPLRGLLFARRIPRRPWSLVANEEISLAVRYDRLRPMLTHLPAADANPYQASGPNKIQRQAGVLPYG